MTTLEALIAGMVWGCLSLRAREDLPFEVDFPAGDPALLVLRWKSGAEVLITVSETRSVTVREDAPAFRKP